MDREVVDRSSFVFTNGVEMTERLMRPRLAALLAMIVLPTCGFDEPSPRTVVSDSAGVAVSTITNLPSLDDSAYRWRLTKTRSIPTQSARPDEPPLLYDPGNMTRLQDGTLVVEDGGEVRLVVIDAETDSVVSRFGREGEGPGEILHAMLWPAPDRTVRVADLHNARTTRFTLDGEVVSSVRWPLGGRGGYGLTRPTAAGQVVHRWWVTDFVRNTLVDSLAWVDLRAGELRNFMELPRGRQDRNGSGPLFGPRTLWTVLPTGGVVTARSHSPVFRYFSREGELLREIRLPLSAREVSESERRAIQAEFRSLFREAPPGPRREVHSHYRITNRLHAVDDSTFALYHGEKTRAAEDPPIPDGQTVWRLITISGRYAGTIFFPERVLPRWVGDGVVLGVSYDTLAIATIEEYALEPPQRLWE